MLSTPPCSPQGSPPSLPLSTHQVGLECQVPDGLSWRPGAIRSADTALPSGSLRPSVAADPNHTADQARVTRKVTNRETELL